MYTYIPSLLNLPPSRPPPHPSRSPQSIKLSILCYIAASHQLSLLLIVLCMCQGYSKQETLIGIQLKAGRFSVLDLCLPIAFEFLTMCTNYMSYVLAAQLFPTLCDSMNYSLPGSSVHGILQARILEWVAISFSRGSSQPRA